MGTDEVVLLSNPSHQQGFFHADYRGRVLSTNRVDVHELIAWGLDEYPYRGGARQKRVARHAERAQRRLAERRSYATCSALLEEETKRIEHLLFEHESRSDLHEEYEGLNWKLGVVDLHRLLAFQRRLVFSATSHRSAVPLRNDWSQLISFTLGSRRDTKYRLVCHSNVVDGLEVSLYSANPDLELRLNSKMAQNDLPPISLYGGSPFFEVAAFRDRWFLRDGYHRAYRLLQAGVHRIPAVIIYSRTIEEIGAAKPWFFGEGQLFSNRPPRVKDFLDESLILRYERVALQKVIRVRIEESLQPFDGADERQGECI